jgi:hypothetical protein
VLILAADPNIVEAAHPAVSRQMMARVRSRLPEADILMNPIGPVLFTDGIQEPNHHA